MDFSLEAEVNDTPPHALDCFETGEKPDTRLLNKENKLVLRWKIHMKTVLTHDLMKKKCLKLLASRIILILLKLLIITSLVQYIYFSWS